MFLSRTTCTGRFLSVAGTGSSAGMAGTGTGTGRDLLMVSRSAVIAPPGLGLSAGRLPALVGNVGDRPELELLIPRRTSFRQSLPTLPGQSALPRLSERPPPHPPALPRRRLLHTARPFSWPPPLRAGASRSSGTRRHGARPESPGRSAPGRGVRP